MDERLILATVRRKKKIEPVRDAATNVNQHENVLRSIGRGGVDNANRAAVTARRERLRIERDPDRNALALALRAGPAGACSCLCPRCRVKKLYVQVSIAGIIDLNLLLRTRLTRGNRDRPHDGVGYPQLRDRI